MLAAFTAATVQTQVMFVSAMPRGENNVCLPSGKSGFYRKKNLRPK
jgi:hypothetical protein